MLHRPQSIGEALDILANDAEAKPLAGGATLVAMLNAQLVEPRCLVSLARIDELRGTARTEDGGFRVAAMTRHCEIAEHAGLNGPHAVLRQAAGTIANPTIRAMGTIGGSVALNDPAADYPPALVAMSAAIEIAGRSGTRLVAAREYFLDWYTTALAPGELVTAIRLPAAAKGGGVYHKVARVAGDFAIASVALVFKADGTVSAAIGACGPHPLWHEEANAELGRGNVASAGALLTALADPVDDSRASATYRRRIIPRMLDRAFAQARELVKA